ncbi:MAG TPA: histidine phosphatase family protein [Parvibaculum sp.]
MPIRLTLISNASTIALRHAAFPGDEALDAHGAAKAAAVAASIPKPDRTWVSPLRRARQTAEALGLPTTVEPLLRDCDYGHWTGRSFDDIAAEDSAAVASWISDPSFAGHGGESVIDLRARIAAWLDAVSADDGHIVAVTHAAVIRAAIVHTLCASSSSFWKIDIAPLTLTDLRYGNGRWTLRATGCPL